MLLCPDAGGKIAQNALWPDVDAKFNSFYPIRKNCEKIACFTIVNTWN